MTRGPLIAITGLLLLVPSAAATTRTDRDSESGARFTLTGRDLDIRFSHNGAGQRSLRVVRGERILAACAASFSPGVPIATARARWPKRGSRLRLRLSRDVSDEATQCLLERAPSGRDVAGAGFGGLVSVVPGLRTSGGVPRDGFRNTIELTDATGKVVSRASTTGIARFFPLSPLPGRYTLSAYQQLCSGSCARLAPPGPRCSHPVRISQRRSVQFYLTVDFARGCELRPAPGRG